MLRNSMENTTPLAMHTATTGCVKCAYGICTSSLVLLRGAEFAFNLLLCKTFWSSGVSPNTMEHTTWRCSLRTGFASAVRG